MASPNLTCATRCCTASAARRTTARATRGASIRCTTTRTRSRTRSRASRTRSARSSSRIIARSTTGCSTRCRSAPRPDQIEFARLNLTYTVMSKRKLLQLVQEGACTGWDDPAHADALRAAPPRLHARGDPRVLRPDRRGEEGEPHRRRAARALRARGPEPARAARDGRARTRCGRDRELPGGSASRRWTSSTTPRTRPPARRKVPFSRVLYIERDDFREDPPKKFFRLAPGREVRLRNAYFVTCTGVVKDDAGDDRRAALHVRSRDARRRRARTAAR